MLNRRRAASDLTPWVLFGLASFGSPHLVVNMKRLPCIEESTEILEASHRVNGDVEASASIMGNTLAVIRSTARPGS